MGGHKWTADRNEKLLLILVQHFKTTGLYDSLAADWVKAYPNEDFHPTSNALHEQMKNLRRKTGTPSKDKQSDSGVSKSKSPLSGGKKTPNTKRGGSSISSTPSKKMRGSGGKTVHQSSDDDDAPLSGTESDRVHASASKLSRPKIERQNKIATSSYLSDDDDDVEEKLGKIKVEPGATEAGRSQVVIDSDSDDEV